MEGDVTDQCCILYATFNCFYLSFVGLFSFFSFFLREHFELTLRSLCTGVCIVVKKAPLHKRLFVSDVCKSTALVRFNSSPLAIRFMSLYGGPVGPGPGVSWVSVVLVSPGSQWSWCLLGLSGPGVSWVSVVLVSPGSQWYWCLLGLRGTEFLLGLSPHLSWSWFLLGLSPHLSWSWILLGLSPHLSWSWFLLGLSLHACSLPAEMSLTTNVKQTLKRKE